MYCSQIAPHNLTIDFCSSQKCLSMVKICRVIWLQDWIFIPYGPIPIQNKIGVSSYWFDGPYCTYLASRAMTCCLKSSTSCPNTKVDEQIINTNVVLENMTYLVGNQNVDCNLERYSPAFYTFFSDAVTLLTYVRYILCCSIIQFFKKMLSSGLIYEKYFNFYILSVYCGNFYFIFKFGAGYLEMGYCMIIQSKNGIRILVM